MNTIKIALLQIEPTGSLTGNLQKGIEYCNKAKELGAEIVLFPEMWSNRYDIGGQFNEWEKDAISLDSAFVESFSKAAKTLNIAIGVTLLEKHKKHPRNTIILFDRYGEKRLTYSKVHTCDFSTEINLTPGEDFYVAELNTSKGNINVGAMICYDREFPESARILMLKGAELILVPNACPMEINRLSQLRARAYENMLAIATCNYPKSVPDCNGGSSVFDGVAYVKGLHGSRDTCLLQAGEEEGIYVAELDLDILRDYRKREVHGNAYRRPKKYKIITQSKVEEPFLRSDHRD